MSRFSPRDIVQELRRRRLFNTVALYIVGAWAALQVTELALPGLNIPDFAIRYVWIGAFALFPLVLFFGWRYDISTNGIKRTPSAKAGEDAGTPLKQLDKGIIGVLSIIGLSVIAMMVVQISQVEPDHLMAPMENSIAVLPFTVCEGRVSDQDLAGGLTLEVINRLAERRKLKVIARASSFAIAGFGLPRQQIAESLGVQYLLSGELCREGGELLLMAELSDAQGFIAWSDHLRQEVNPFEQVTKRLSTLVASGVAVELGDVLPAIPEVPVNRLAYEQLLIGQEHFASGDREQARGAFDRALQHQPNLADAHYHLALLEFKPYWSWDQNEGFANARPGIEKALTLARNQLKQNDRDAQTQYVVGRITAVLNHVDEELFWRQSGQMSAKEIAARHEDFSSRLESAENHLRTAITLNPSMLEAYGWLAEVMEAQGLSRSGEALEILESGLSRDPFNLDLNAAIARNWVNLGRYRQAIELLDRFRELPKIPPRSWWWQLQFMNDHPADKCETLIDMLLHDPEAFDDWDNRWHLWALVADMALVGLYEEAETWKVRIESIPMHGWAHELGADFYRFNTGRFDEVIERQLAEIEGISDEELIEADADKVMAWSQILANAGEYDRAYELVGPLRNFRDFEKESQYLAAIYKKVGRFSDAAPILEQEVTQLEAEFAAGFRDSKFLVNLAEVYALQGRDDKALNMLQKALDYGGYIYSCSLDFTFWFGMTWHRLRQDSRYVSICIQMEAESNQQAARIRTLLAQYDIDELLAPLKVPAEDSVDQ